MVSFRALSSVTTSVGGRRLRDFPAKAKSQRDLDFFPWCTGSQLPFWSTLIILYGFCHAFPLFVI